MARLRLQAPVRRPNSRKLEPSNLLRIHDSLQLKNTGITRVFALGIVCASYAPPSYAPPLLWQSASSCFTAHSAVTGCYAADGESKLGFSEAAKLEEVGAATSRRRYNRDSYQQFSSHRSTTEDGESSLHLLRHFLFFIALKLLMRILSSCSLCAICRSRYGNILYAERMNILNTFSCLNSLFYFTFFYICVKTNTN